MDVGQELLGRDRTSHPKPRAAAWALHGAARHPLTGDHYTVKAGDRNFGSSERLTWNFADFDESTLNLVTGESGVFLSPYYLDQWRAWYGGETFTLPFSPEAIERHREHELVMTPR